MNISVIIPTCNRKSNLLALLKNLNESIYPLYEVIIIDSGEDRLLDEELSSFKMLHIQYKCSEKSVCIQRNKGITMAKAEWIFLCDDDIEMPKDYLQKLVAHISEHANAGAVSGLVLQKEENNKWVSRYDEKSVRRLFWKYVFKLSIWGKIECPTNNFIVRRLKKYYDKKGNYLSSAGWPVLTDFTNFFTTQVYGLGASLIKKEWLLNSLYDEVLDSHGIGDHYGVAAGFPGTIHVVTDAFVYHHQEKINRLEIPTQYYRRVLALDYFITKGKVLSHVKKRWLTWSLFGNFIQALFSLNGTMLKATFKSLYIVGFGKNPYIKAADKNLKIIEPNL